MSWSTGADLRGQVQRRWERGELLRHIVTGEPTFPLRLTLKGPGSGEITERFEAVRAWMSQLRAITHVRIELREIAHRVQGSNAVPQSAWVDSLEDALAMIGKRREATCFRSLVESTRAAQPLLLDWMAKRPLRVLELAGVWERLLDIVCWIQAHPHPGIYLRQVDIPSVHSKLIEAHRGVLTELLERVLPATAINPDFTGPSQFTARYGFLEKPARIRFRVLDERLALLPGVSAPDIALDWQSFANLAVAPQRIFITENETNFLAFPPVENALVIFGAGYGWEALAQAHWLNRCKLFYWGDIDTHGFAILNQLRKRFSHVESLLMDRQTLLDHQPLWGSEADQVTHDLPRLTDSECALFNDLRDNRIRKNLRLEQEMVAFGRVEAALRRVAAAP